MRDEAVFAALGMFLNLLVVDGVGIAVLADWFLAKLTVNLLWSGLFTNLAYPRYVVAHFLIFINL